jgi:transcriptional regulator with XRE-family HTH domain
MATMQESLGGKIRRDRKAKGWTLKGLSSKVGISLTTLQRIEAGGVSPSVELMVELAYALGRPVATYIPDKLSLVRVVPREQQKPRRAKGAEIRTIGSPDLLKENVCMEAYEVPEGWISSGGETRGIRMVFCIAGILELTHRGEAFLVEADGVMTFDAGHPYVLKALAPSRFFTLLCGG